MQLPNECPAHSGIVASLENVERRFGEGAADMKRIEDKLDVLTNGLRTRLPWFAVALITGLFGLACTLLTLLIQIRAV